MKRLLVDRGDEILREASFNIHPVNLTNLTSIH